MIYLDSFNSSFPASWRFGGFVRLLQAEIPDEVPGVIAAAEAEVLSGNHVAGYIAYEAASAINPELPAGSPGAELPLVRLAVFREKIAVAAGNGHADAGVEPLLMRPELEFDRYSSAVEEIRGLIAAGDSYQVNFTFPLSGEFHGDPAALYARLCRSQRAGFCAMIDTGEKTIISASPELFFSCRDGRIMTRPMKGTAPRGRWPAEDSANAETLAASDKERAENLMIVDLLRNDLGRISETGSVQVDSLFDIEHYPTVHQMTSTVSASLRDGVGFGEILSALFPCGSVTGAPKRRSMEIINQLEQQPRGVYCGAIGCLSPGGEADFSVAIRTLVLDNASGRVSMGVGSGITWDSQPDREYAEALGKGTFLQSRQFELFETLRLEKSQFARVGRHLDRLESSARLFGIPFDRNEALRLLKSCDTSIDRALRVKLLLEPSGRLSLSSADILPEPPQLVVGFAKVRRDPADRLLYHKTSCREALNAELRARPDCGELIFVNTLGELTEGSYNNLILNIGGVLVTPPLESGLLPGVMRQELLENGEIEERRLCPEHLQIADEILLVNSLRGIRRAVLAEGEQF